MRGLTFLCLGMVAMPAGQWYSFLQPPPDDLQAFAQYAVEDRTYAYDRETIATMGEWNSPDARATLTRGIELKGISKKDAIRIFRDVVKKRKWNEFIQGPGDECYGFPGPKGSSYSSPYTGNTIVLVLLSDDNMHIVEWRFMTPVEIFLLHQKQIGKGPVEWTRPKLVGLSIR